MTHPNIYEELEKQKDDIKVLQVAIALLAQKLYPVVKIDSKFWDEVHATVASFKEQNQTEPVEEATE